MKTKRIHLTDITETIVAALHAIAVEAMVAVETDGRQ
jgi:hypothetical protein